MHAKLPRTAVLAAHLFTLAASALAPGPAALAEPAPRNPPLAAVGPVSPIHPLPRWYQDAAGVQLEPCLDATTPGNPCALAAAGAFNPALPIAYPTNFPTTVHYTWANAEVATLVAGKFNARGLVYVAELVGTVTLPPVATASVFTHLRFDTNESLTPFTTYTITHPYGTFTLTTDDRGDLCPANQKLCDISFPSPAPNGVFTGVLGANLSTNPNDVTVGSFLPVFVPPAGFIGDGASKVQVSGSPKGTNFVRIQGPTTGPAAGDLGTTCPSTGAVNCAEGNLFTIIGRQFNPAGGPTTRFAVAGPATAGAGVAQTFTVTATDVNGNTTTGYTGIVRLSSNDPQAQLGGDATLVNGVGTFQATPKTVGTFVLTARDTVTAAISGAASLTVTAGPVASLTLVSGDGQVGGVGAALAAPLVVRAADAFGNPKGGVSVTFTPPAGGAVSPATTLTDLATGLASTTATLGPAAGSQAFSAAAAGVAGPVTFGAVAGVPGEPVTLAITGLSPATTAGVAAGFTVTAFDAFGNLATLATGAAGALSFSSTDAGATLPQAAALSGGTASLSATFRAAGARTLTATLTTTPSATATVGTLVGAGAAARLALVSGGGQSGTVGQALAAPLVVLVTDAFDNPRSGVAVAFSAPAGGAVSPASPVTGADGTASVAATLGSAAGAQAFSAAAAGLLGSPLTFPATAAPGPAAALSVTDLAPGVTAGVPAAFTVTARDAFGNVATGFAGSVAFTSSDGAATLPAATGLSAGTASLSATFRTAGARTLTATQVGAAGVAGSASTTVAAAAASALAAVSGSGQSGTVGQPLAAPFVVRAADAFGNPVAGVAVTFAAGAGGGSIAPVSAVTGATGQASATATLGGLVGAQAFTASSAGLAGSPVPFGATAAPGAAAVLAVTSLPPATTAGVAASFTVTARDTFGNVATGFAGTVTFTSTDPVATLPAPSALTAGAGAFSATFFTAGARTLTATVTGSPGVTGAAATAVAPGAPAALTLTGAPAVVPAGLAFQVTVDLRDAYGNAPADLRVSFTSSDPNAVLPVAPVLVQGSGLFDVTLVGAGARSLTVASSAAPAVSSTATVSVTAGAASRLVAVSGDGQSALVGAALPAPFVVRAEDAFGNPKSGVLVDFAAPATGSVSPAGTLTAADGTAGATGTLGRLAGPQAFSAALAGGLGAPVAFTATAGPGPAATLTLAGLPAAVAAGTVNSLVVTALDGFGNVATGFSGAVLFTTDDPAQVVPSGAALTAGSGTFPVVLKTVGSRSVTVQAPGAPGLTATRTTQVTPAAPAAMSLVATPGTTAPAGASTASPVTVLVTDSLGNPAPGFTVGFSASAGASISPASATTGADGRASATPTVGTAAGAYTFTVTAAGLQGSPGTFTVTAVAGAGAFLALERPNGANQLDCGCYDLTARLQDQFGNAVAQGLPGVTVTAGGQAQVTATDLVASGLPAGTVTGTLKPDGTALVRVCDRKPEVASVAIAAAGFTGASLQLTWLLGPLDPAATAIESDTALLTAYSGRAHLSVTPRSACGNPLGAGLTVRLGLNGPGSITATTDQGDGRYTATADVTPCPATLATEVTARVGAVDLAPLGLAIACVAPSADQTQVTLGRTALELCDDPALDQVAVSVTPRDAAGAPMGPGNQVSLAMAGLTGGAVTDAGDGSYTATISAADCSTTAPRPLTVRVNGVDLAPPGAELTVTCAPVDGGASGVSVAGGRGLADGTSQLAVTVAAVNTCNRPARGRAVQVSTTLGTIAAPTGTTDAAGTHRTALTSAAPGSATVSATVGGVAVTSASVTFDAPPSGGGGGCQAGGAASLPALVLAALGLLGQGWWRRR